MQRWFLLGIVLLLFVVGIGCALSMDRNGDGALNLSVNLTEETIQEQVSAALSGTEFKDIAVDLQDGYILVTGTRERDGSSLTDALALRLDLDVSDGHLTAAISQATVDGIPLPDTLVSDWNARLAERLSLAGQSNPNSTLQAVTVTADKVTLTWRIEGQQGD